MQQVTIHAAKTQLSKLIEAALAGEGVVIAKGRAPVIRLVPFVRGAFQVSMLKGQLGRSADFFEAQDETDLQLWEGGAD